VSVIEGRGRVAPILAEMYRGENLILRVDDKRDATFWLTVRLSPAEVAAIVTRYLAWLKQTEQWFALACFDELRQPELAWLRSQEGRPASPPS